MFSSPIFWKEVTEKERRGGSLKRGQVDSSLSFSCIAVTGRFPSNDFCISSEGSLLLLLLLPLLLQLHGLNSERRRRRRWGVSIEIEGSRGSLCHAWKTGGIKMGEMYVCVGESLFALLGFFIPRSETEIRQSYSKWAKKWNFPLESKFSLTCWFLCSLYASTLVNILHPGHLSFPIKTKKKGKKGIGIKSSQGSSTPFIPTFFFRARQLSHHRGITPPHCFVVCENKATIIILFFGPKKPQSIVGNFFPSKGLLKKSEATPPQVFPVKKN